MRGLPSNGGIWKFTRFDGIPLNLAHPKYCVVGEAHGFTTEFIKQYHCNVCSDFSINLFVIVDKMNDELYETVKQDFVTHWNEKHV